jgi:hypothetical protein
MQTQDQVPRNLSTLFHFGPIRIRGIADSGCQLWPALDRPLTGRPKTSLQSCPRRQCGSRMHRAATERADPMTFRPADFDPSIDPTSDKVRVLRDAGPVVMLNLPKVREQANCPAGSTCAHFGRAALQRWESVLLSGESEGLR